MTHFTAGQMFLNGEKLFYSFYGKNLQQMIKFAADLCCENILTQGGYLPLPLGYIHVYDPYIQTSAKLLGQLKQTFV